MMAPEKIRRILKWKTITKILLLFAKIVVLNLYLLLVNKHFMLKKVLKINH